MSKAVEIEIAVISSSKDDIDMETLILKMIRGVKSYLASVYIDKFNTNV